MRRTPSLVPSYCLAACLPSTGRDPSIIAGIAAFRYPNQIGITVEGETGWRIAG
jgi:hypothetical protein